MKTTTNDAVATTIAIDQAKEIIKTFPRKFSSMDFIQSFKKTYAEDYKRLLQERDNDVQRLHQWIARWHLTPHQAALGIKRLENRKAEDNTALWVKKISDDSHKRTEPSSTQRKLTLLAILLLGSLILENTHMCYAQDDYDIPESYIPYTPSDRNKLELLYQNDKEKLMTGYEWVTDKNGNHLNEGANSVRVHYPVEATYYTYDEHPEFAIVKHKLDKNGNRQGWFIYNKQGGLVRVHSIEDDMEEEMVKAEEIAIWEDFKSNKYNVMSEDPLTIKCIEMKITGDLEKLKEAYLATLLTKELAMQFATSYSQQQKIMAEFESIENKWNKDVSPIIAKEKRAESYINQLKEDNSINLYKGRCIRIDDKSFYYSLVDQNGKASRLFRIVFTSEEPFKVKKTIHTAKLSDRH